MDRKEYEELRAAMAQMTEHTTRRLEDVFLSQLFLFSDRKCREAIIANEALNIVDIMRLWFLGHSKDYLRLEAEDIKNGKSYIS